MITCLYCHRYFGPDRLPVIIPPGGVPVSVVAWCEECDPKLNLGTKIGMITEVCDILRVGWPNGDYDAIEDAAHRWLEKSTLTYP